MVEIRVGEFVLEMCVGEICLLCFGLADEDVVVDVMSMMAVIGSWI